MHGAGTLQQLCVVQVPYNSYVWCMKLTIMYDADNLQKLCMMQLAYNSYAWCR